MSDTRYEQFQHYGTNAQRLAFTPSPAAGIQPIYIWYETDTGNGYLYDTSWHQISGSGVSGMNQLTGDVTAGPGTGSQAATIANNAVTNAKFRQGAALSVVGVTGNATANVADIAAGTSGQVLRRSGTALAFGAVDLAAAAAVTGILPIANGGTGVAAGAGMQVVTATLTNAQIKALPTTPITLLAAPGANLRFKLMAYTLRSNTSAGAYTNINTTYADLHIITSTTYLGYGPINDSTVTPTLTQITDIFGAAGQVAYDGLAPYVAAWPTTSSYYVEPGGIPGISAVVNQPLQIGIDNNGSGDFTGGNVANSLKVIAYYIIEDLS